tara:strand:+ start:258 stop:5279 length:5022 start_codon:yes stop_codon:yes gene_type:complete
MDFIQFIPPELRKNAAAIVNGVKYAADAMKITDTNQINQLGKDVIKNIRAGKVMPTLSSIARYTTGMTTLAMDALPGAKLAKIPIKGAMDVATMIEKGMIKKGVKVPENADEVLIAMDKKIANKNKIRVIKEKRKLHIETKEADKMTAEKKLQTYGTHRDFVIAGNRKVPIEQTILIEKRNPITNKLERHFKLKEGYKLNTKDNKNKAELIAPNKPGTVKEILTPRNPELTAKTDFVAKGSDTPIKHLEGLATKVTDRKGANYMRTKIVQAHSIGEGGLKLSNQYITKKVNMIPDKFLEELKLPKIFLTDKMNKRHSFLEDGLIQNLVRKYNILGYDVIGKGKWSKPAQKVKLNKAQQQELADIEKSIKAYQGKVADINSYVQFYNPVTDKLITHGKPLSEIPGLVSVITKAKRQPGLFLAAGGPVLEDPEPIEETEEVSFVNKMKDVLFPDNFDYPYKVASNEPIDRGFIEDIENSTPEQRIKIYQNITLQPFEDNIKDYKEKNKIDPSNENLSLDAQSYLDSKNYKDEAELLYRRTVSAVQMCQPTPDMPWCRQTFPQGIPTIEEVKKTYEELQNSNDFKVSTQRANGEGVYAESTDAAKKEIATMQAKRVPANIADVVLDVYQLLFPPAFVAGEAARMDKIRQGGEAFDGDDLLRFFGENNMGFLDVDEDGINDLAKLYDDLNIKFYPEGTEPREPTKKEKALSYTMTAGSLATVFMKPGYVSNIVDVLSRKDIGKFGKIISVAPRLIGVPTKAEVAMLLGVIKNAAVGTVKTPFKIIGQGTRITNDIQGGPQGIIVSAPGQPGRIVKNQIASKVAAQNMIKNIDNILAIMASEEEGKRIEIDEQEYQANIAEEIKNPQYTAAIKTYYDNFLRQTLVNADAVLGEVEDVSVVELLATKDEYEDHPAWVVEYAKDLAKDFIKENNLKTNTIGDTLFYDMLNPKKLAMGGDPGDEGIFTDPLAMGDDDIIEIDEFTQSSPYLGTDELDMFEESKKEIPTIPNQQESIFDDEASYEVAQNIFGKVPGWAIAGVNKVDDLIRTGKTGTRIAQADAIADAATSSGEKINRFYSNIEARLLDPNAPKVFETPADLYNFLNSKGISKIEVEDYQIPQLIETMSSLGKGITKEDLLLRIKNAPLRQLETKTFGFRSEIENGDEFISGKYPNAHMEKGYIPNSYRENVIFIDSTKLPNDIQKYKYSTHGFFKDDENKYVIGWSRLSDRYGIIPGTSKQLSGATDTKLADLQGKFNRLEKISVRTPEELVSQSNGRITIEQAKKNIDRAKKDLNVIKNEIDNFDDRTNFVTQPDVTTRVTFADEIQSDIFQKYRKVLEEVKEDYQKLMAKSINPQDTSRLEELRYGNQNIRINTDNIKILQFYDKHKDIMRPMFKTADDFAAHIKDLKESNKVFEDFSKIRPGTLQQTDIKLVQEAGKKRDKVLEVFEQAFTDKKTMEKLFPNIPFKDRKAWGDAIIKNDIYTAAKRLFIDKDANAAEWYAISPAELIQKRYSQSGTTATALTERTKDMKGIGTGEFYGGPNAVDPSGKHYTGVLEEALKRAAKANNTEFKIIKVSIGDPKTMQRSFQILSPDGKIVKTNKLGRGNDASEGLMRATQEAEELGEGFTVKAIEIPKGFKTVDAYAIKLTPEMVLPSKTHFASGGYALYDPLVSMDEVIGAY